MQRLILAHTAFSHWSQGSKLSERYRPRERKAGQARQCGQREGGVGATRKKVGSRERKRHWSCFCLGVPNPLRARSLAPGPFAPFDTARIVDVSRSRAGHEGRERREKAAATEKKLLTMSSLLRSKEGESKNCAHQGFDTLLACLVPLSLPNHRGRRGRYEEVPRGWGEEEKSERAGRQGRERMRRPSGTGPSVFFFGPQATREKENSEASR